MSGVTAQREMTMAAGPAGPVVVGCPLAAAEGGR